MPRDSAEPFSTGAARLWVVTATTVAALALGVWLWSRLCDFPAQPWNDIRLAPTVALAQGRAVFPTAEEGTINTWTYGPLPLLWSWPATWATTPPVALMIAGALNIGLVVMAMACVCLFWPAADARADTRWGRWMACIACAACWPEIHFAVVSADNLAIACGLLGNLVLVRRRRGTAALWVAAALATAASGCKQTAAGIPLAQVIWIGVVDGAGPALRHAGRCVAAGIAIAAVCLPVFGVAGLQFVLLELPAHFQWAPRPLERLMSVRGELLLQIGLPGILMVVARRAFARREWLLPALAWACALPLGFSGLLKLGGRMNSVYAFMLWLPPVAALVATTPWLAARRRAWAALAMTSVCGIMFARIATTPRFFLRPQVDDYREAARIAERLRGQVWFPFHPLVTLYTEHRYYHDEDGLYVRRMTHKAVTAEHAASGLPPQFRAVALHAGWTDFGIARSLMPGTARHVTIGNWELLLIEPPGSR